MKILLKVLLVLLLLFGWLAVWQGIKTEKNNKTTLFYNVIKDDLGLRIDVENHRYVVNYPFDLGSKFQNEYSKSFTLYWYGRGLVDKNNFISEEDYITRWPDSAMSVTFWLYISDDYNRPNVDGSFLKNGKLTASEYPMFKKYINESHFSYKEIGENEEEEIIYCTKIDHKSPGKPACAIAIYIGDFAKILVRFPPEILSDWVQFNSELNSVFNAISYIEK